MGQIIIIILFNFTILNLVNPGHFQVEIQDFERVRTTKAVWNPDHPG